MARLPVQGGDDGTWGNLLNDYLEQEHNADGSHKSVASPDATTTSKGKIQLAGDLSGTAAAPSVPGLSAKAPINNPSFTGTVTLPSDPSSALQAATKQYVDTTAAAGTPDATTSTKGSVQLAGDLAGTAASPQIAPGVIVDADVNASAAIAQSKVAGLTSSLAAKEPTITAGTTSQYYRGDKSFQTLDKAAVGLANVDNTSDANKPISTATQTALNTKAIDSAVVHNTGTETISGVKTFSSSPIVPTPTNGTDATNKTYVDSQVSGSTTPDATTTTKGKVQLAGDLAGTAALPTVPGLASKVSTSRLVSTGTGLSGGGDLSADRTLTIDGTVVTLTGSQTLTNKTLTSPVINTPTGITKSDVGLSNVDNTSDATKNTAVATLTNKDLTSSTNNVTARSLKSATTTVDVAAATAPTTGQALIATSSTTATWQTLAASGNMSTTTYDPAAINQQVVGTTATQTLTNKTLTSPVINTPTGITKADVGLGNVDNTSDTTKNAAVATLTNKTITDPTNTVTANGLRSATTTVSVSSATAPTTGQVLTATGASAATWQTAATGGDFSSNTATSVDGEVVLFSGTGGKTGKRATGTGLAVVTSGVLSTVTAPSGAVVGTTDTQTLTNKTIIDSGSNLRANSLKSATTTVDVSAATAPTSGQLLQASSGTTAVWATITKTHRIPHTWGISGTIAVPSGDTDFILPFFVPAPAGQTVTLKAARYIINSGTSVTAKLQKNGSDITGYTSISVTTTAASTTQDASLADNDKLALVVTAVSGTPKNMSFTLYIDYAV